MAPLEWRLEGKHGTWELLVEGALEDDVELHLSRSAATVTSHGQPPFVVPLPAHAAADPVLAVARRKHGKLVVSWPKPLEPAAAKQRLEGQTLEEKIRSLRAQCRQLDSNFKLMQTKYDEMTQLARDKLLSESGAFTTLEQSTSDLGPCECVAPEGLSVEDHAVMGRCLTAQKAWSTGKVLFRERPCIQFPMKFSIPGEKSDILEVWENLRPEQQAFMEDFAANLDVALEKDRLRLALSDEELSALAARGHAAKPDTLLRFVMADRVNSHRVGCSSGLFAVASKASHSCQPNCRAVERGSSLEVVSLQPIAAGERVSLSYIADEALLFADRAERRRYLWERHFFWCTCDRCQGPDAARCFRCECGGDVIAQSCTAQASRPSSQHVMEEVLEWRCADCERVYLKGSDNWLDNCLARESTAVAKWRKLQSSIGGLCRKIVNMDEFVGLRFQERTCASESDNIELSSIPSPEWADLAELRKDLEEFAPRHWLLAHAELLASDLALTEVALGNPLPLPESEVLSGVTNFVQLGARTCPQAGDVLRRLVEEARHLVAEMRSGTLQRRFADMFDPAALNKPSSLHPGEDLAPVQLGDLD